MILAISQQKEFEKAAHPLIKWLNENCHPHVVAIIDPGSAALVEGVYRAVIEDYIKD